MKTYLSLVIPAYNEENRIGRSLKKAEDFLSQKNFIYEIIVVDDGSSDRTANIAHEFSEKTRVFKLKKNEGKGAAVRRGMLEAKGELRVFTDADFSTPIYELDKILQSINNGYDICIGSRALVSSLIKKHQPFYREFMGKTFNKIVQVLVLKGIKDTQCGFKGFTENAAVNIFEETRINGFGFDVELLYLADKMGYKIQEVPVEWYNDHRSTVNPITDSFKMILEIMRIKKIHSIDK